MDKQIDPITYLLAMIPELAACNDRMMRIEMAIRLVEKVEELVKKEITKS